MKRHLQFVAILVICLLAAQPALAGFTCNMATAGTSPECSHNMPAMAADCAMNQRVDASACESDCCGHAQPVFTATYTGALKPKLALLTLHVPIAAAAQPGRNSSSACAQTANAASTLPRYLVLHVFRI